ncbi:hypothetical protein ACFXHA_37595 [Nocardia sp. NPDC059240]|uniref:hypothetical protein n=1 Tax=Nocardia sp. NPDC059240 TaxID=3346786 RepID=UPI00367C3763
MTHVWRRTGLLAATFALLITGSAVAAADPGGRAPEPGYCEGAEREASLMQDQQRLLARLGHLTRLNDWGDVAALAAVGWMLPTHLHVNFENTGLAIARPEALLEKEARSGNPGMAVYRSVSQDSLAAQINPYQANFPYELIGWAHGIMYTPGVYPTSPDLCISKSDWFVHEQGAHTFPDFGFVAEPPREDYLGQSAGDLFPLPTKAFGPTHGRFWDVHLWLDPQGGPPATGIERPFDYIPGAPMPHDSFFFPEQPDYQDDSTPGHTGDHHHD